MLCFVSHRGGSARPKLSDIEGTILPHKPGCQSLYWASLNRSCIGAVLRQGALPEAKTHAKWRNSTCSDFGWEAAMDRTSVIGWVAVGLNTVVAGAWAFWGTTENFHEAWFSPSLARNLLWTCAYLSFALLWTGITCTAIRWPRAGAVLTAVLGLALTAFVLSTRRTLTIGIVLSWLPSLGLFGIPSLLWWFGNPKPRRLAWRIAAGVPLAVVVLCAAEPVYRISQRNDDGFLGARLVQGNGIALEWAPAGPGWPSTGVSFEEAQRRCQYLRADGLQLSESPRNIWRLPTVDEVARSMTREGRNVRGEWNEHWKHASFARTPDKESPLWDPHSQVIYWWTSSRDDAGRVYRIVFNGRVDPEAPTLRMGSLGFRAVRAPSPSSPEL